MTDSDKLEAFIVRAGFKYGSRELESQARRMAERAVKELAAAETDAARYRWLREHTARELYDGYAGTKLDIAVDIDRGVAGVQP